MFRTPVRFKHKVRERRHSRHSGKGAQRRDRSAQAFPSAISQCWARLAAPVDCVAPLGKGDGYYLRGASYHERGQFAEHGKIALQEHYLTAKLRSSVKNDSQP